MEEDVISELKEGVTSTLEALQRDLAKLRTGRASVRILDDVRVDYFGSPTPLNQCASLAAADARMITVKPFDKTIISDIERAILQAGIGITPQNDGDMIRLPIPQLTEERRRDLVKQSKSRGEDAKIALRNHRKDANDMLKEAEKEKELSEDDLKRALTRVQGVVDDAGTKVNDILGGKEKEILEI